MKILETFGENRLEFEGKSKLIKIWWIISIEQLKIGNIPAESCASGQKMKKVLKIFKKILRFLIQISKENWLYLTNTLHNLKVRFRICQNLIGKPTPRHPEPANNISLFLSRNQNLIILQYRFNIRGTMQNEAVLRISLE